ncbi:olfactory receptor 4K2-like [Octodon degus]|uniref:Olfactory receptor n=1 Tax=Octodon degus TaxID=10160 RepID=A0A6P3FS15_OCTDE|nr:olfactory receptor 4K2-like [Octodon degus]
MEGFNHSRVSEFVLLGLTDSFELQIFFFVIFSIFYLMTMFGNCLILLTVLSTSHLHSPMFFLISNLSLIDMCLSSFATPKMIMDLFAQHKTISFEGCISQIFFLHLFTGTEIVLLISMSFDRYTAICKPLHYSQIMSQNMCIGLVVTSWIVGFLHTVSQLAFTLYLPFCGPNVIDSFFCDLPLVIQLACIDMYILGVFMVSTSGVIALISFLLLLTSYITVLITIRGHASTGSSKILSTCTAHFIVVLMFFGPCIVIYVWPFTNFLVDKILSVFYTIFTPFLNPLIYTLRNLEVRTAVKNKLHNRFVK